MAWFLVPASTPGPKGDVGLTGPQGPVGSPANVIYSGWKSAAGTWVEMTKDGTKLKTSFILAPQITQAVMDSAVVLVYAKFTSNNQTFSLPYTSFAGGIANTLAYQAQIETKEPVAYKALPSNADVADDAPIPVANQGRIRLFRITHDNSGSIGVSSNGEYRYIIIPGGVAAGAGAEPTNWNSMTYEQVKARFSIPD